jgi:tetratricopeptide (TPR) repeat protein
MALQDLARYKEARSAFNSALAVMPAENHERLYRQLGLLSQDESKLEEAEHWFRKAVEARPADATAYIYLGATLAKNGRFGRGRALAPSSGYLP